ncbi:uncharacterized protein LOC114717788 [Neltuma alba]|uniref:uncharacterized protein LOC114717788 n=1 Tax=Neltuma alba TaxID=207710 RepID=UPI0010A3E5B4|nr:uncharacterized protein LOC114717788 [Prosopis alba]
MNFMIWNSRGTGSKAFPNLVQELRRHYHLDFLALLETRADKQKTEQRISRLGFQEFSFTEAVGFSGGIWCLWGAGIRRVEVLEQHKQFIHLRVENSRLDSWCMTVVYASPNLAARRSLWSNLSRLGEQMQEPWVLGGDFNATLFDSERKSIAPNSISSDRDFGAWFETHSMEDLGFVGPWFSWKRGSTEARLDRFIANDKWHTLFPQASVAHLPFYKSDHRPMLLRIDGGTTNETPQRPFRFIASWVLHDDFGNMVRNKWDETLPWNDNLAQFTSACKHWNRNVFGHIEGRKQKLLSRLEGVTKAIARGRDASQLEELQLELWRELEDVLLQESLLWAQKA